MDQPRPPDQAVVRHSPTHLDDFEEGFENTQFMQRSSTNYCAKVEWNITPQWLSKPSLIVEMMFPKPQNDRHLPYFSIPTVLQDSQTNSVSSKSQSQAHQSITVRRRRVDTNETSRSTHTVENGATNCGRKLRGNQGKDRGKMLDPRVVKHNQRKIEILETLQPLVGNKSSGSISVLLCWGKPENCDILPVVLSTSADDVEIWKEIRRAYYARRGYWRSLMPLFAVKKISIAEVSEGYRCEVALILTMVYVDRNHGSAVP